jgi:hypothetical protein
MVVTCLDGVGKYSFGGVINELATIIKMRIILTIIFCFLLSDLYSQKKDCGNVKGMTVDEVYNEIIDYKRYTLDDARCFGDNLARHDKKRGIKRILTTLDLFETTCLKCIYHKFGFDTDYVGSGDIIDENRDAFIDCYNRVMESSLTEKQKLEIHKAKQKSAGIFDFKLTTQNNIKIDYVNDTTINMKMYSDSFEKLFKSDSKNILVEFSNKIENGEVKNIDYFSLKNNGIDIPVKFIIDSKLYIWYDFSKIQDNYEICWCDILNKKYGLILPIKFE